MIIRARVEKREEEKSKAIPISWDPLMQGFKLFFGSVLFVCSPCLTHFTKCLQNNCPGLVPAITMEQTEECLECDSPHEVHFLL